MQRRLGQIATGSAPARAASGSRGLGRRLHRPPGGEQGQRAPAGGPNECLELVVHGRPRSRADGGRAGRARSRAGRGARSRTASRRRASTTRSAGDADAVDQQRRDGGAGEHRRDLAPQLLRQQGADLDRRAFEHRRVRSGPRPTTRSSAPAPGGRRCRRPGGRRPAGRGSCGLRRPRTYGRRRSSDWPARRRARGRQPGRRRGRGVRACPATVRARLPNGRP